MKKKKKTNKIKYNIYRNESNERELIKKKKKINNIII